MQNRIDKTKCDGPGYSIRGYGESIGGTGVCPKCEQNHSRNVPVKNEHDRELLPDEELTVRIYAKAINLTSNNSQITVNDDEYFVTMPQLHAILIEAKNHRPADPGLKDKKSDG